MKSCKIIQIGHKYFSSKCRRVGWSFPFDYCNYFFPKRFWAHMTFSRWKNPFQLQATKSILQPTWILFSVNFSISNFENQYTSRESYRGCVIALITKMLQFNIADVDLFSDYWKFKKCILGKSIGGWSKHVLAYVWQFINCIQIISSYIIIQF